MEALMRVGHLSSRSILFAWLVASPLVACTAAPEETGAKSESELAGPKPSFCQSGADNICIALGIPCTDDGPGMTWVKGWEKFQSVCRDGATREAFCDDPAAQQEKNACHALGGCAGDGWLLGWD